MCVCVILFLKITDGMYSLLCWINCSYSVGYNDTWSNFQMVVSLKERILSLITGMIHAFLLVT